MASRVILTIFLIFLGTMVLPLFLGLFFLLFLGYQVKSIWPILVGISIYDLVYFSQIQKVNNIPLSLLMIFTTSIIILLANKFFDFKKIKF